VVNKSGICINSELIRRGITPLNLTDNYDSLAIYRVYLSNFAPIISEEPGRPEEPFDINKSFQPDIDAESYPSNEKTPSLSDLYKQVVASVFTVYVSDRFNNSLATGFFIAPEGLGVSNYHVFENVLNGEKVVKTFDGTLYKISSIIEYSEEKDYIIFKVEGRNQNFNFVRIADFLPEIGTEIFTIGNPHGLDMSLSKGIVSAYREDKEIIQFTSEIAPGSSGGPIFNMQGEVIGIATAKVEDANINFGVNIKLLNLARFI
jgi:serine protease Do